MLWATKLYEERRWLFWLLLPVVGAVFVARWFYKPFQGSVLDDVEKANQVLEDEIEKVVETIKERESIAEKIEEQIENRSPDEVPLDWHKHT